jgi:hypothetical protein
MVFKGCGLFPLYEEPRFFGRRWPDSRQQQMISGIKTALECGVTAFDTAGCRHANVVAAFPPVLVKNFLKYARRRINKIRLISMAE